MNIERFHPISDRRAQSLVLARTCWNLSNELSAGRWHQQKIRNALLNRSIVERLGQGVRDLSPVFNDVQLSFQADKYLIDDDGILEDTTQYKIAATVAQEIHEDEIHPKILDEIFEGYEEDEHHDGDLLEEMRGQDGLSEIEIVREQEVEYLIDEGGNVTEFNTHYRYQFDGTIVHEVGYDSTQGRLIMVPIRRDDPDAAEESRPLLVTPLTEEVIQEQSAADLDQEWGTFLVTTELREAFAFGSLSQKEHRRRAMSMIALLTTGMYRLSDLTKKHHF